MPRKTNCATSSLHSHVTLNFFQPLELVTKYIIIELRKIATTATCSSKWGEFSSAANTVIYLITKN